MSFPDDIHTIFSGKIGGEGMFGSGLKTIIFGIILGAFSAPNVWAQDALPQSAGDLDGFKLEPLPERPNRPPPDEPLIVPRNENETPATLPQDRTPNAPTPRPSPPPNMGTIADPPISVNRQASPILPPRNLAPSTVEAVPVASDSPIETLPSSISPGNPPPRRSLPRGDVNNEQASVMPANDMSGAVSGSIMWWLFALLALASGIFYLWRRHSVKPKTVPIVTLLPPLDDGDDGNCETVPMAEPVVMPPAPKPILAAIQLSFDPLLATIGLFNLTIKGRLELHNHGNEPLKNLRIRARILSSSMEQAREIAAFHDGADHVLPAKSAMIYPGETMVVDVTLTLPKAEFMGFKVGKKEIFVPLIVAELSYIGDQSGAAGQDRLVNLVGREVHPPPAKMAPLFTDKNAQSITSIGCRPLLD